MEFREGGGSIGCREYVFAGNVNGAVAISSMLGVNKTKILISSSVT